MDKNILVSICCLTYNHKNFIKHAIDSFLQQKTNFDYEIIIHDDNSDDGTREILKKYESDFPNLIRVIYQQENIYTKGINPLAHFIFPLAKGKFLALCEGDDYWTDPNKLQKQVDILEVHPEYSMCFTARNVVDRNNQFIRLERYPQKNYTTKDIIDGFIPATQTIIMHNYRDLATFRKRYSSYPLNIRLISYYCSLMGPIYYLDEVTACYRESGEGVWSSFDYWTKREKRFERFREFYSIIGIEENNLSLIDRGVYEFLSRIKAGIKNPLNLFKNLKGLYHFYLKHTPLSIVFSLLYLRIKKRIFNLFIGRKK